MSIRKIQLAELAAHLRDEVKTVERHDVILEVIDGGKVVAVLSPPPPDIPHSPFSDSNVSGHAHLAAKHADPDAPCFMDVDDAQDFWSDLSASRIATLQRIPVTQSGDEFYGPGSSEDWEGFDESLAQWRSEPVVGGEWLHAD